MNSINELDSLDVASVFKEIKNSEQKRQVKENSGAQPTARDVIDRKADFSSPIWSASGSAEFAMSTYTSKGTLVEFTANKSQSMHMGKASDPKKGAFNLGGSAQQQEIEYSVTFSGSNGGRQTFTITENSRFRELNDGTIVQDHGEKNSEDEGKGTAILINLEDGAFVGGGEGDDVIFNVGAGVTMDGAGGDDVLLSMGNGNSMRGGSGNDLLKVVRDVLRDRQSNDMSESGDKKLNSMVGMEKRYSVLMDGGDGNDLLDADVKLENSTLNGGDGDDLMQVDTAVKSTINGGAGMDSINARLLYQSTVNGGAGDDTMNIKKSIDSKLNGGSGNDTVNVEFMKKGSIDGGSGNDSINITHGENSSIKGGTGDDSIYAAYLESSTIDGGAGNDSITINDGKHNTIRGGDGDDEITIGRDKGSTVLGGWGNDRITVYQGKDMKIIGGLGDDLIDLRDVKDSSIYGDVEYADQDRLNQGGNDTILVGKGSALTIKGNAGADTIIAEELEASYVGGDRGDDAIIIGEARDNILAGDSGDDYIRVDEDKGNIFDGGREVGALLDGDLELGGQDTIRGAGKDSWVFDEAALVKTGALDMSERLLGDEDGRILGLMDKLPGIQGNDWNNIRNYGKQMRAAEEAMKQDPAWTPSRLDKQS